MADHIAKCERFIHSLKQDEKNVLGETTIIKKLGDNAYLADYNGVKCTAIYNPFVGRYFVDDKYGKIHEHECPRQRGAKITVYRAKWGQTLIVCPHLLIPFNNQDAYR